MPRALARAKSSPTGHALRRDEYRFAENVVSPEQQLGTENVVFKA